MDRPWTEETLKKHPKMSPQDRAKIFAPLAALRGHSERLGEEDVKLMRSERVELSEDEAQMLSDKLSQIKKGMNVTVTYFQADEDSGDVGYYLTLTGVVTSVDLVYRVLKIDVGNVKDLVIGFEDILDVSRDVLVDIESCFRYEKISENSDYND
ncbi:MAG: YolD-like family protein [Oscillospiraceae bacterium]|nr:YolD-like family protein [Oscillospiraceae bacterium]